MTIQPQTGIASPQGNGKVMEKMPDGDRGVRGTRPLTNGLTKGTDSRNGALSKAAQGLGNKGDEFNPHRVTG